MSSNETQTISLLKKKQPLALWNFQVWSLRQQKPEEMPKPASTSIKILIPANLHLTVEFYHSTYKTTYNAQSHAISSVPWDHSSEMTSPFLPSPPRHLNLSLSHLQKLLYIAPCLIMQGKMLLCISSSLSIKNLNQVYYSIEMLSLLQESVFSINNKVLLSILWKAAY